MRLINYDHTDPCKTTVSDPIDHGAVCYINQIAGVIPIAVAAHLIADRKAGADMGKLKKALESSAVKEIIAADMAEARKFEFSGTPGFLVNGVSLKGAYPFDEFKRIIDRHLDEKK